MPSIAEIANKLKEYVEKRQNDLRNFAMQSQELRAYLQNVLQITIEYIETIKQDLLSLAERVEQLEQQFQ